MSRINGILIAIDFSEPALNALDMAMHFAEKHNAKLYLLYVHENIFESGGISSISLTQNSSNVLAALASDIHRKIKVKPVIIEEEGYVPERILNNAINCKCDLIVMGAYGSSGYRNGYIGSNTYSVVKFAPCPILIIPGGSRTAAFNRPLFPVRPLMPNFKNYDFLKDYVAESSVIFKIDTPEQWSERNTIGDNILLQADKNNSDLIILPPAIDVSTKQYYIGPIAHRIVHHAKVPVLIIKTTYPL